MNKFVLSVVTAFRNLSGYYYRADFMSDTRTMTCALAIGGGLLIGSQAMAQETDPGLNPYFFVGSCNTNSGLECPLYTPPVPAGKRLVIQRVSAVGGVSNAEIGTRVQVNVGIQLPTGPAGFYVSNTEHDLSADGKGFAFDQPVLGYADAGSTVFVHIFPTTPTSGVFPSVSEPLITVTGHLIDCTQTTTGSGRPPTSVCAPIRP